MVESLKGTDIGDRWVFKPDTSQRIGWDYEKETEPSYKPILEKTQELSEELRELRQKSGGNTIDLPSHNRELANGAYNAAHKLVVLARDVLEEPETVSRIDSFMTPTNGLSYEQGRFVQRMALVLKELRLPGATELEQVLEDAGFLKNDDEQEDLQSEK